MADSTVLLQKATQSLGIAYNAYQGSSFCKIFAVKSELSGLSEAQVQARQSLLRMLGQLVDTEFERAMDELTSAWTAYRSSTAGGGDVHR